MAQKEEPLGKEAVLGLAAMALAVFVIANDFTALSVALPMMERDFKTDVTTVQWVINGYALVFGVLIVTGGRLADVFGRRHIFFLGSAIFALFSFVGGLTDSAWMLIFARGAMGIGGAMMWPAILGMTYALVPRSRAGIAGGLIIGVAGFGNSVGPLLGGALTDFVSWRWIFFLNVPIAAFAVLVTWRVVPVAKLAEMERRVDYLGVLALSICLVALLLALDLGTDLGWTDLRILGLFALAVLGFVAFGLVERGAGEKALLPSEVIENRGFFAAVLATLLMSAIFFAALLYLPQFMSKVLGYSAVGAGAGLLPMMGVFGIVSVIAGRLYARIGAKLIVSLGALCLAAGMFLLSWIHTTTAYLDLVPGMVVLGIGVGLFYSSITTVAITALDEKHASLGGAIVYMVQIAGGAVGLGLNTAIVVSAADIAAGMHVAFLVDAALAVCGLAVAVFFVGGHIDKERLRSLMHHHRAHG